MRLAGLRLATLALAAIFCTGGLALAEGRVFRYASAFDPATMDPHALATVYNARVLNQIFDTLTARNEDWVLSPLLALSWTAVEPKVWRFKLRPGVKFHDGTPFNADDVVFNVERGMLPTSAIRNALPNVTGARKVDDLTVDIVTSVPTPSLPLALSNFRLMSKVWAVRNHVESPQDFKTKSETNALRSANGTGPFKLKQYDSDVKTVLVANPDYWGPHGNVTEAQYLVVGSAATRLAGIIAGDIDFIPDAAIQDISRLEKTPGVKVLTGIGLAAQFLGFDHARDKLLFADAGPRNPFKDVRVRQAVRFGIDLDALQAKVMRNLSVAGSAMYTSAVDGYDKRFDRHSPYDPGRAKALLREAGYPEGFAVTLHCSSQQPADSICQAVTSMLARVGIRVSYQPVPFNNLVPKVLSRELSFFGIGWVPTTDAEGPLNALVHSNDKAGSGEYNGGNYSNPKVDALIEQGIGEADLAKRSRYFTEAMVLVDEDVGYVPLMYRRVYWVVRSNIRVKVRPNDSMDLRYVNMD
jgi:peptide/nickel transport system substrate-binding protein